jgi:hypothetical protein
MRNQRYVEDAHARNRNKNIAYSCLKHRNRRDENPECHEDHDSHQDEREEDCFLTLLPECRA